MPFLLPVAVDGTKDSGARVPDSFLDVQWTRVSDEESIARFVARVAKLVDGSAFPSTNAPNAAPVLDLSPDSAKRPPGSISNEPPTRNKRYRAAIIAVAVVAVIGASANYFTQPKGSTGGASVSANGTSTSTINPLSVMVMPFANQTGDAQKAYIADALTSSITGDLSRIRDATIIPATTAFSLADKKLTIPQLGKEATVRFVLTGNVTGNNEKLRISAALSDTQTGAQLWTENFDGSATNLFALQDQVTSRIGGSIGPQMIIAAARESEKRANKPEVADLLMRAAALNLNQQSVKNNQAMLDLYRQALAIEPDSISAKVRLATTLSTQVGNYWRELNLEGAARIAILKQAADLAEEVQRVEPNNPDTYSPRLIYAVRSGDFERGLQLAKRRVELDPKSTSAHHALGLMFLVVGDMPSARASMEKALQFTSPARRPTETYHGLSRVALIEDRPDEAIKWAQQALDANPNWGVSYEVLALAYVRKGDEARARKAAAEAVRLRPHLRLNFDDLPPWPGKEAAYKKYIETQYLPAWRLAGLPE